MAKRFALTRKWIRQAKKLNAIEARHTERSGYGLPSFITFADCTTIGPSAFHVKNPAAPAVKREAEENWGKGAVVVILSVRGRRGDVPGCAPSGGR
jgi:hypothetical protein